MGKGNNLNQKKTLFITNRILAQTKCAYRFIDGRLQNDICAIVFMFKFDPTHFSSNHNFFGRGFHSNDNNIRVIQWLYYQYSIEYGSKVCK